MRFTHRLVAAFNVSVCMLAVVAWGTVNKAPAATFIWDGTDGTGTDLGISTNWNPDGAPNGTNNDVLQWNGSVAGNLNLANTTAASLANGGAGTGISIDVTAAQVGSLTIDGTQAIRIGNGGITIASGAGAFKLGDDSGTFAITLGVATATHTFTNNSTNTATIGSDVRFGNGNAANHTITLAGTGNWSFTNDMTPTNTGATTLNKTGTGTFSYSGISSGATGPFNFGGGTSNLSGSMGTNTTNGNFRVGTVAGAPAILNVLPGSLANARFNLFVGDAGGGTGGGAVYQSGGTVTLTQAAGVDNLRIGSNAGGYGYYNLTGGTVQAARPAIGASLADTVGVVDVLDGTFTSTERFDLVAGTATSSGLLNVKGGSVNAGTDIRFFTGAGNAAQLAVLNVGGGANPASVTTGNSATQGVNLSQAGNVAGMQGVVNLLPNGTLTTGRILGATQVNPTTHVNFNGGTLRATLTNAGTIFNDAGPDAINVYSAGGSIDNNGTTITINKALLAPAGAGVNSASISVPSGGVNYTGAPLVKFSGGTGTGATGYATISGGVVTGITMTSPGVGYTVGDTLTATFVGGGAATAATNVTGITVAANTSGAMTFKGTGTTILSGANTYTGTTTLQDTGKLVVTGSLASPVAVTSGTLDGTGSVGATTVADNSSNTIANGNNSTGALTLSSLTFSGDATVNVRTASPGLVVTGALTTNVANGVVTINPTTTTGIWADGPNNLISFGSFGGNVNTDFALGSITGTLGPRQAYGPLVLNGNNVALQINGDSPKWTGLDNGNWVVGATGASKNWKLISGGTATDYIEGDIVLFDDSVTTGTTAVTISTGSVSPSGVTFNNSTKSYTVATANPGTGISGIAAVVKNGTNSVTISSDNSYSGATTINAGTLTLSGSNTNNGGTVLNGGTLNVNSLNALGTGTLTVAAGAAKILNNTSGSAITMTDNIAQSWNDDFTFTGTNDLNMGTGVVTLGGGGTARSLTVTGGVLNVGRVASAAHGLTLGGSGVLAVTTTTASNIAGAISVGSGATLRINTGADALTTSDFIATSLTGAGTIENGGGVERWMIVDGTTDSTFSGLLRDGTGGGALGLSKRGTSTLTVSANNTLTGATTINGGTLKVTGALSATSSTTIGTNQGAGVLQVATTQGVGPNPISLDGAGNGSTARLELLGDISLNNTISFPQRNNTSVAIENVSGNNTLSGAINIIAGGTNARIQSDAGSLTLSGGLATNTTANRTVTLQGVGNGVVSGVISSGSGTINIAKEGAGTWSLNANDTYTGTTTVSGGVLLVNGTHAGAGTVSVASGGTLGGSGTIDTSASNANASFAAGSALSPGGTGPSAGTLTLALGAGTLDVQFVNSGGLKFDLGSPAIPSASDLVKLNSGTLIGGALDFSDFTFTNLGTASAGTYKLFDAASVMAVTIGTASGSIGSFTGTLSVDNANFDVLLTLTGGSPAGDFNNDGKVNSADYVIWRKDPASYGGAGGYSTWRANFGNPLGSGSSLGASGTVPEPTGIALLCLSATFAFAGRRFGRRR